MHQVLDKINCWDEKEEVWKVVVESPRGGRHKYKYDPHSQAFTLHRILPEGMSFPADFGFLPHTRAADGDPIDVLVLIEDPTFTGCIIPCHLIGVIEATQTEKGSSPERNDRLIAVPADSRNQGKIRSIKDLDQKQLSDMQSFFIFYNQVFGKQFKVRDVRGPHAAEKLARDAIRLFEKHR
jgi:inorganic pyrophosphatase